jgi:hypothetical protein
MRLYKFAALLLLGSVSLWAQTAPAPSTKKDAPAATDTKKQPAKHDHSAMHKGCACDHAKDATKKECHCKEMMAGKEANAEMCNHGKAENMSMSKKDAKDETSMAKKEGCCGCCGGKCDRMKHKMEHDKSQAPKAGM